METSVYDPQNIGDDAFDRTNHTGTQLAATISDLDTEIGNHTDVAANTAARHTHSNASVLNSITAAFTTADETKLDGIATGATANSSDATLLARANHTGTQAISTVTNLQTELDGKAATSHTHVSADITDLVTYTTPSQAEAEAGTATTARVWTAERVKQAIEALAPTGGGSGPQPPAYAGTRTNPWDEGRSLYNWKASSTSGIRNALARADQERVLVNVWGHSGAAGGGDATLGQEDMAAYLRQYLFNTGAPVSGTGMVLFDQNLGGVRDSRLAFTGTWTASGNDSEPWVYCQNATNKITLTADMPGTIVDVAVPNATASIGIYIDGNLAETYQGPNHGGTATAHVVRTFTGLSNTLHTVELRCTTAAEFTFGVGMRVRNETGIEISNLGRGGAEVADWIDTDFLANRPTSQAIAPADLVILQVGANEALAGTSLATMVADYQTLLTYCQTNDIPVIMLSEAIPPPTGSAGMFVPLATWETWLDAYYDLADEFDVPLIDVSHAFVSHANEVDMGIISADNLHLNDIGYAMIANLVAQTLFSGVVSDGITNLDGRIDTRISSAIGSTVQGYDADTAAIGALSPSNDDIIQRKSGAWTNRTMAQLKSDLALNNVLNLNQADAGNLSIGVVATARLGSGTANNTSYLRGDQTWQSSIAQSSITNLTTDLAAKKALTQSISAQSGSYTLVLADAEKLVTISGTTATLTVPQNSSVAYPVGTTIEVFNRGTGDLTITGSGVTFEYSGSALTLAAKKGATLKKLATDTWAVIGGMPA